MQISPQTTRKTFLRSVRRQHPQFLFPSSSINILYYNFDRAVLTPQFLYVMCLALAGLHDHLVSSLIKIIKQGVGFPFPLHTCAFKNIFEVTLCLPLIISCSIHTSRVHTQPRCRAPERRLCERWRSYRAMTSGMCCRRCGSMMATNFSSMCCTRPGKSSARYVQYAATIIQLIIEVNIAKVYTQTCMLLRCFWFLYTAALAGGVAADAPTDTTTDYARPLKSPNILEPCSS